MTTSDNQYPSTTRDDAPPAPRDSLPIEPTWATGATYARDVPTANASTANASTASASTASASTAGATAMPQAPRRGIAVFPTLLGLIALGVAATVASYEYDRHTAGEFVGGPLIAGFGGLLVLLALVGLVNARVSRSRRARGGDAPSA